MKRVLLVIVMLVALGGRAAFADEVIDLGGASISIPTPEGTALVTPEMSALYEVLESTTPPQHTRYVTFIPQEQAAAALSGRVQDYFRTLTVQDVAGVGDAPVSMNVFQQIKDSIRTQNEQIRSRVAAGRGEDGDIEVDAALRVTNYVPLPFHVDEDRMAAFSAYTRTSTNLTNRPGTLDFTVTMSLVQTRGRALLLHVGALENDIEWAQAVSRNWAAAILAANDVD